jgi:hypothetical protein
MQGLTHDQAVEVFKRIPVGKTVKLKISYSKEKWMRFQETSSDPAPKTSSPKTSDPAPKAKFHQGQLLQVLDQVDGRWYKAVCVSITATHVTVKYPELRDDWEEIKPMSTYDNR